MSALFLILALAVCTITTFDNGVVRWDKVSLLSIGRGSVFVDATASCYYPHLKTVACVPAKCGSSNWRPFLRSLDDPGREHTSASSSDAKTHPFSCARPPPPISVAKYERNGARGSLRSPQTPGMEYRGHRTAGAGSNREQRWKDDFSFMIARNPWHRLVSAYHSKFIGRYTHTHTHSVTHSHPYPSFAFVLAGVPACTYAFARVDV